MYTIDPLLLLDYVRWGNDTVIAGARMLPQDALHAPVRVAWLSPLGILTHMLAAERVWLARWRGHSPDATPPTNNITSLDELVAAWKPVDAGLRAFIAAHPADHPVSYTTLRGEPFTQPLWQLVMHVVNHNTEHRSQVALVLAQHAIDSGNLDLVYYLREREQAR